MNFSSPTRTPEAGTEPVFSHSPSRHECRASVFQASEKKCGRHSRANVSRSGFDYWIFTAKMMTADGLVARLPTVAMMVPGVPCAVASSAPTADLHGGVC